MVSAQRAAGYRISAYILLADPAFLRESVQAYYAYVDRIVVSFDRTGTSWTGTPLPVAQCLEIVRSLDVEGKCVETPGDFARPDHDPLENDTHQRQAALDAASEGADWVLQIDTDEVIVDPPAFFDALARADRAGAGGLDYPARWLYSRVAPGRYLERCGRFWRRASSYPGPLAVRAGTRLSLARQAKVDLYRVDIAPRNTDPWHPDDTVVDEVVRPDQAVVHLSWVRQPEAMRRKFGWSGHAGDLKPPSVYRAWKWRSRHPQLAVATSLFRPRDERYRPTRVPEPPGGEPIRIDAGDQGRPGEQPPAHGEAAASQP